MFVSFVSIRRFGSSRTVRELCLVCGIVGIVLTTAFCVGAFEMDDRKLKV